MDKIDYELVKCKCGHTREEHEWKRPNDSEWRTAMCSQCNCKMFSQKGRSE